MTENQRPDPLAKAAAEGGLPTMSTDNTPEGRYNANVGSEPIARVSDGMKVVDAAGDEIGKVRHVRMGDPDAATTRGQEMRGGDSWLNDFAEAFAGGPDDVPESVRNEMVRVGFIQIDAKGLFQSDFVAAAFQIAAVTTDTVELNVNRDALVRI